MRDHHSGPSDNLRITLLPSEQAPKGVPRAGAVVLSQTYKKAGDDVGPQDFWTLRMGVRVPAVAGLEVAEALKVLTAVGLSAKPSTLMGGVVSDTKPVAGTLVPFRESVVVVVEPDVAATTVVPDVLRRTRADAVASVIAARLEPDTQFVGGPTKDDGRVVRQDPPGRTTATAGDTVVLFVVAAQMIPDPEVAIVPPLIGGSAQEAHSALQQLTLVPVQEDVEGTASDVGLIVRQRPKAGSEVPLGSPVAFQVVAPVASQTPDDPVWLWPAIGASAVALLGFSTGRARRLRNQRDRDLVLRHSHLEARAAGGVSHAEPRPGAASDLSIYVSPHVGAAHDELEEVLS